MDYENEIDLSNPLWENPDFPHFYYNHEALSGLEASFKSLSSELNLCDSSDDITDLKIEEIYYNSKIEGIELDKNSIGSSYTKNLTGSKPINKEDGAVKLLELAIKHKNDGLTHAILQEMNHVCLINHPNSSVQKLAGEYVGDMMIIRGGRIGKTVIEDRGVPADQVQDAMENFIIWYNNRNQTTPLANAISGHLHFEKIHPFADGNGRVGRAIMNMSLMSDLELSKPLALSKSVQRHRKDYYNSFNLNSLDLTETIKSLFPILRGSLKETKKILSLTSLRAKVFQCDLHERQIKGINKIISKEIEDVFEGKITNLKYRKLTGISDEKMAQRDLKVLVEKELLRKEGKLKGTHYLLNI